MPRSNETPRPRRPAAQISPQFIWPTPDKSNLLFWVERDGNLPKNKGWALGDAWRDTITYPDHKLIHVTPQDADGWSRWYYANDRVREDNYNFEFTQSDIGGQKFHAVRRSYLLPRADFDPEAPAAGAAMPRDPSSRFPTGYVLAGRRQQRTGDDIFDGIYVVETRTYVQKITTTSIGVDDLNGGALAITETLYYATETVPGTGVTAAVLFADTDNAYWGVQSNGTQRTGRQLGDGWFEVIIEDLVSGSFEGGGSTGILNVGSYVTTENYFWPPVLSDFEFMDWARRDGGVDVYPRYEFLPDGYRGPCPTVIKRKWSSTPHTIPEVVPMLPTPITYACPFFRLAVPACLHGDVYGQCDIGNTDPIYSQNAGSLRTTERTNYMAWPGEITGEDYQQPYKGGYLRIIKIFQQPDNTDQD